MYRFVKGNLFDNVALYGIDGIFAPVFSHRSILVDEFKQSGVFQISHLLEYTYMRELSEAECKSMYLMMLDTLVKMGAQRIATYSLYFQNGENDLVGKDKVKFIDGILNGWYEKNKSKIEDLYFFDLG